MSFIKKNFWQLPPEIPSLSLSDPINQGLVGFWLCNDYFTYGSNINDLSSSDNKGTIQSPPSTQPGLFGRSILIDNASQYITLGTKNQPSGSSSRTMSGWIKGSPSSNIGSFFGYGAAGISGVFSLGVFGTSNIIYFAGYGNDFQGVADVMNDKKHHIAATYDGNVVTIWVDGHFDSSKVAGALSTTLASFYINTLPWSPGSFNIPCLTSGVRLHNRVLSPGEIGRLAVDPYAGLVNPMGSWITDEAAAPTSSPMPMLIFWS